MNQLRSVGVFCSCIYSWLATVVSKKEDSSIAKRVVEITIREAPMKSFEHTLTHHSRGDGAELCRDREERRFQATPPNQALEPTTLAVTIPAAQEVAPAKAVAHL